MDKMSVYEGETLSAKFMENGRRYNIYFAKLEIDGHLTDEESLEIETSVFNSFMEDLLALLNQQRASGFNFNRYAEFIPSGFAASFGDSCIYAGSQRIMTGELGYTKTEQDQLLARLGDIDDSITAATAYIDDTFLKDLEVVPSGLGMDLEVPSCMQTDALSAWVKQTEERFTPSATIEREVCPGVYGKVANYFYLAADTWPQSHKDKLDACTFMRVKFRLFDSYLGKYMAASSASIDGNLVKVYFKLEDGSPVTNFIESELGETVRYTLRIKKKGYSDIVLDMKAKIDYRIEDVPILDLGTLELRANAPQAMITLSWDKPFDLDSHLYLIERKRQEDHIFFFKSVSTDKSAETSKDIVDASNLETTKISPLDPDRYYLFSVYNYSRYLTSRGIIPDGDKPPMNVEVKVQIRDVEEKIFTLQQPYDSWWWDVAVIHNGHIYSIDSMPNRSKDFFKDLTKKEIEEVLKKMS